ncbi:CRISPR-associated helicase/endonuclease Cas3 [Actinosynnema sp. NPDC047251]|uniref:CRISPR-associated helicase Cas3 n=1 Tax=Saccharothrix espanaensis (strain ATCC 51144 / DSM 44229 / JCM 9112 / NBRC 15066 / NRRL 15764) TaxID=1179773 RepID=K0JYJ6_SACES|nr:CRISPR-associated helicase/endonuclease Cas3 [Saccharothrix espanaensis]CCH29293.1 CRISPR-associated helicase Cas3 [Saccharothrix espanaensis DSM 44229]
MRVVIDWRVVWAKSVTDAHGEPTHWLPLQQHLDDSALVAARLVDEWVSPQVVDRIAQDLPDGVGGVRVLCRWLAACHDVGKASPAFAVQVPEFADRMRDAGVVADPMLLSHPQRSRVNHALVGYFAVRDFLRVSFGDARSVVAEQLAGVVASHHGVPPERSVLKEVGRASELVGTGVWEQARTFFLERASTGVELARYRDVRLSMPSQVLLTSIVIIADWIASNAEFFPLLEAHEPPEEFDTAARLDVAWQRLGLPARWRARPVGSDVDAAFRARFRPEAVGARPVQVAAVEVAAAQGRAGLLIVEAPMGVGKTEAALLAAEELAARTGADGCFVALPTQATSDAMFGRVRRWLDVLPGLAGAVSVTLAHGKASLNEEFDGLVRRGWFASIGQDVGDGPFAHSWMSGRKKGVLASFVVGTIDQVLFAGLKSRHLMLRHLGLAGKVVVIDEVHAYDVYMSQYLGRVLQWLGAYRVPVVLLSATLPVQRRAQLVAAYEGSAVVAPVELGYPVIVGSGGVEPRTMPLPEPGIDVDVDKLPDDLDALVGYLRNGLRDGGCAVVVRNTVTRVQETAARLEEEFGEDSVTIAHSRFLACDRARIDLGLLRRFGPDGERPGLHVVVASQVVEQSLDVDFDVMVTDLAPMDLVLQRLGRLHRHGRTRPASVSRARCAVVGVEDWAGDPVRAVAGSRRVYGEHLLLRSAALLVDRAAVTLPAEISTLVQAAYGSGPIGPASWQRSMEDARSDAERAERDRSDAARTFLLGEVGSDGESLVGWIRAGVGEAEDDPRGAAQVRDGAESLEVLVVQSDGRGGLTTPSWIGPAGDEPIPVDLAMEHRQAKVIAACALRLPVAMSNPGVDLDVITALEANRITSFHLSPLLRGQLVLVLGGDRTAEIKHGKAHFHLTYDPRKGLMHERG